jgi:hypothetical protein
MLDGLDLCEWVLFFDNIIQRVLMKLCHRGKITKTALCIIKTTGGLNPSQIHKQTIPRPNWFIIGNIQCNALLR